MTRPSSKTNYVERVCLGDATGMSNHQLKTKKEITKARDSKSQQQKKAQNQATVKAKCKEAQCIMNYVCASQSECRGHLKRQCQKKAVADL